MMAAIAQATLWLLGSVSGLLQGRANNERTGVLICALPALVLATAESFVSFFQTQDLGFLPLGRLAINVVGVTALSLSPQTVDNRRAFSRIAALVAFSLWGVSARRADVVALAFAASTGVAWTSMQTPHNNAARLFAIYQLPSTLMLLLGGVLLQAGHTPYGACLMAAGIAVRQGVFPLHSWFVPFVEAAPLGVVVAFSAPQIGVVAYLSWALEGMPTLGGQLLAGLCAFTAVLAAALGVVQNSGRRALAYFMLSKNGLLLFGLANDALLAHVGAMLAWFNLALGMSGFAMTLAALEARRGALLLSAANGAYERTPRMAVAMVLTGLACVGLPTSLGFVAEDLLMQGLFEQSPPLAIAFITATALNALTVLRLAAKLFGGTSRHHGERDFLPRERVAMGLIVVLLMAPGLMPSRMVSMAQLHAEAPSTGWVRAP